MEDVIFSDRGSFIIVVEYIFRDRLLRTPVMHATGIDISVVGTIESALEINTCTITTECITCNCIIIQKPEPT